MPMGVRWRVIAATLLACACTPTRPAEHTRGREPALVVRAAGSVPVDLPVITTMRTRDREVVVYASAGGLRFTVRDESGSVLADRVDRDGFAAAFPTLGSHFDTAFAGETLWLDASVVPTHLPDK
jgi:hypothetical protein